MISDLWNTFGGRNRRFWRFVDAFQETYFEFWKMSHRGERLIPKRFQAMFMRACAVALIVFLALYTLADVNVHSKLQTDSWTLSSFLQSAVDKFRSYSQQPEIPRKRLLVLLWNNYFLEYTDWLPSTQDLHCPVTECDTTSDRTLLENSSAVILHWRNIDLKDMPPCHPSNSTRCPLWVLFNKEAPPHTPRDTLEAVEGKVHWTATYRADSDLFAPYGKIVARSAPYYAKTVLDPNKRLVCWLVSNCDTPSKREAFVSELEEYIEVDMYGKCSNMKCPHKTRTECYQWLSAKCLFYLSLENSVCKDYTTEKLYHAMATDMIPVVMGNSTNYRHLPPHSYINAADFRSPKELAEHLVMVGKDRKLYRSYLSWKRHYEAKDHSYKWFCDLCERLHSTEARSVVPRRNLVEWWFDQSGCWSWRNL